MFHEALRASATSVPAVSMHRVFKFRQEPIIGTWKSQVFTDTVLSLFLLLNYHYC